MHKARLCIIIFLIMALGWQPTTSDLSPSLVTTTTTTTPSPHLPSTRSLRLPNDTYPLGYHLHISSKIHEGDFRFNGNATIDIEIRTSTNEIVLHAKNLSDIQVTLRLLHDHARPEDVGKLVEDVTHTYDAHGTFLVIHALENYQAFEEGQRYRLQVLYTGIMGTKPKGLYRMAYEDPVTNSTTYVAATQAEPTYTRLILPCYDEPAFKSNFTISLTHSSGLKSVSNMPVQKIEILGELTTTTFQTTPVMSTYLMAFVISNFEEISETYRGVTQSMYSSPTRKNKGRSGLKNAVLTVAALEDYFDVPYSLPKLDHVELKKNQGAAMENWGLITFKEDSIMPVVDSTDSHKRLRDIIMQKHEISHQWFGNLVSPEWWSYVWLNEGFATYFSYIITDMLNPNQHVMNMFIREESDLAFTYSSFFDVRPMTYYVETEADIMNVFDIISYKRAACVIRMFHHAFRQKTFVRGISQYLKKYQFSVVTELNLFDSLQAALLEDTEFQGQDWIHMVPAIMISWTHSEWLPIVSVIRNYENNTITFKQCSLHSKTEHWWIPLNFATLQSSNFEQTHVEYFMPPVTEHTSSLDDLHLQLERHDWLIVNKQQTGFYHVLYDTENLRAIAQQLQKNHTVIHAMNRAALFQDLGSLFEHNEIESIEVIFELFKYLEFEDDYEPWHQVSNIIDLLDKTFFGTPSYSLLNQFLRRLVAPTFIRLSGNHNGSQGHLEKLAISDILPIACKAQVPECQQFTQNLAHEYIFNKTNIERDYADYYAIQDTILCMGLLTQSEEDFAKVIFVLSTADRNTGFFDDIIYSLRCTQNPHHLRYLLNMLMGNSSTFQLLSEKECLMYLSYIFKSNKASRSVIWNFIEYNYRHLARAPNFISTFNDLAAYVTEPQRPDFVLLRKTIVTYMEEEHLITDDLLISEDSSRIGKKIQKNQQFLEKFEHQIHNWLLKELHQSDNEIESIYAASLNVGNGSSRRHSLLSTAGRIFKKALRLDLLT